MTKTRVGARSPLFDQKQSGGIATVLDGSKFVGNIFYVDSGDADKGDTTGHGADPDTPFATIDFAINQCTASQGDIIYVLPGHAETLADATSLVLDTVGVSVIGLGRGTDRPTLTLSATGSNIPISGANTHFENFLITVTGTVNVTAAITVTGTDVEIFEVEMREPAAGSQIVDGIVGAATSDRLHVDGFVFRGHASGDINAAAVSITGAVDGVLIENFDVDGLFAAAGIENVTGVSTNIRVRDGYARNRHATQDAGVALVATTTGTVERVNVRTATDDAGGFTGGFVGDAAQFYICWVVNADGESGGVFGTPSAAS